MAEYIAALCLIPAGLAMGIGLAALLVISGLMIWRAARIIREKLGKGER